MADLFSRLDESNRRLDESIRRRYQADRRCDRTLKELRDDFPALDVQNTALMAKFKAGNGGNSAAASIGLNARAQCLSTRQSKVDSPIISVNDSNGSGTCITAPKLLQSPACTTPAILQQRYKSVEECITRVPAEISNFIGSKFSNPMVELRNLKQLGTVSDYLNQFNTLLAKVEINESHAVHFFVSGLHHHIQNSVRMFEPKSLVHAFALARLQESALNFRAISCENKDKKGDSVTESILTSLEFDEERSSGKEVCVEKLEEGSECGKATEGKNSECGKATEGQGFDSLVSHDGGLDVHHKVVEVEGEKKKEEIIKNEVLKEEKKEEVKPEVVEQEIPAAIEVVQEIKEEEIKNVELKEEKKGEVKADQEEVVSQQVEDAPSPSSANEKTPQGENIVVERESNVAIAEEEEKKPADQSEGDGVVAAATADVKGTECLSHARQNAPVRELSVVLPISAGYSLSLSWLLNWFPRPMVKLKFLAQHDEEMDNEGNVQFVLAKAEKDRIYVVVSEDADFSEVGKYISLPPNWKLMKVNDIDSESYDLSFSCNLPDLPERNTIRVLELSKFLDNGLVKQHSSGRYEEMDMDLKVSTFELAGTAMNLTSVSKCTGIANFWKEYYNEEEFEVFKLSQYGDFLISKKWNQRSFVLLPIREDALLKEVIIVLHTSTCYYLALKWLLVWDTKPNMKMKCIRVAMPSMFSDIALSRSIFTASVRELEVAVELLVYEEGLDSHHLHSASRILATISIVLSASFGFSTECFNLLLKEICRYQTLRTRLFEGGEIWCMKRSRVCCLIHDMKNTSEADVCMPACTREGRSKMK